MTALVDRAVADFLVARGFKQHLEPRQAAAFLNPGPTFRTEQLYVHDLRLIGKGDEQVHTVVTVERVPEVGEDRPHWHVRGVVVDGRKRRVIASAVRLMLRQMVERILSSELRGVGLMVGAATTFDIIVAGGETFHLRRPMSDAEVAAVQWTETPA